MPFESEKQRRFMHDKHPDIAQQWEKKSKVAVVKYDEHWRRRRRKGRKPPSAPKNIFAAAKPPPKTKAKLARVGVKEMPIPPPLLWGDPEGEPGHLEDRYQERFTDEEAEQSKKLVEAAWKKHGNSIWNNASKRNQLLNDPRVQYAIITHNFDPPRPSPDEPGQRESHGIVRLKGKYHPDTGEPVPTITTTHGVENFDKISNAHSHVIDATQPHMPMQFLGVDGVQKSEIDYLTCYYCDEKFSNPTLRRIHEEQQHEGIDNQKMGEFWTGEPMDIAMRLLKASDDFGEMQDYFGEMQDELERSKAERSRSFPKGRKRQRSMGEGSIEEREPSERPRARNRGPSPEEIEAFYESFEFHPGSRGHEINTLRNEDAPRGYPPQFGTFMPLDTNRYILEEDAEDILPEDPAFGPDDRIHNVALRRESLSGVPTFAQTPFNPLTGFTRSEPMDLAMRLLKASRQTELGEHHPELPSSHGPIVYYHGTSPEKAPRIKQQGLRARTLEDMVKDKFFRDLGIPRENRRQLSDEQEFQLEHQLTNARRDYYDRHHDDYPGAYVSTSPRVKHTYGTGGLVGIRAGAGSPEPYFGVGDGWDKKRLFPDSWRFSGNVPPEYLVNMSNYKFPDVPIDEKPEFFTHPPFYVDGQPPEIKQEEDFDEAAWYDKWGGQNERKDIDLPSYWNPDLVNSLPEWDPNQDQHYQRFLQGKPE